MTGLRLQWTLKHPESHLLLLLAEAKWFPRLTVISLGWVLQMSEVDRIRALADDVIFFAFLVYGEAHICQRPRRVNNTKIKMKIQGTCCTKFRHGDLFARLETLKCCT
jgi:hypothetical protein